MVTGDSSEDEDGWRVHERHCIDHRAAFDMHEIINDVFMSAIAFMHESGLRMDEDHDTKLVSLRISSSGARSVVPRIGVSGDAQCASRQVVPASSASPRRGIISFCNFMASMVRSAILARC